MANDYRQRKTIQIKLDVTDGHEHAEVNKIVHTYYKELAKHGNWMQSFRDMVILYETLKSGDMKFFKKLFPGIYLSMVNNALLEAQEKVIDKMADSIQPSSGDKNERSDFEITDRDRANYESIKSVKRMRNILDKNRGDSE